MRTKKEVIDFLESLVGKTVICKGNTSLNGQCVTLIKALMEFLGAPNPYKARGHAKTVISAYLNEGIADSGTGFLSVFSNKDMGGGYGHIWCNAGEGDGTFYESNGVKALTVTKGKTYGYDKVCNFDKYIKEEDMANMYKGYDLDNKDSMKVAVDILVRVQAGEFVENKVVDGLEDEVERLQIDKRGLEEDVRELNDDLEKLAEKLKECQASKPVLGDIEEFRQIGNTKLKINGMNGDIPNYAIDES